MRDRAQLLKVFLLEIALCACAAIVFSNAASMVETGDVLDGNLTPITVLLGVLPALAVVGISV